jgi:hypothetical protein
MPEPDLARQRGRGPQGVGYLYSFGWRNRISCLKSVIYFLASLLRYLSCIFLCYMNRMMLGAET